MTNDPVWDYYDRAATEAFNEHRYLKASRIIKDALHRACATGDIKPNLVHHADALAQVYQREGDYTSAASLYRLIFALRRETIGPFPEEVEQSEKNLIAALEQCGSISPGNA